MEGSRYPAWQKAYHEALLEVDPYRLIVRICAAERLIASRLAELRVGPKNSEEKQALLEACSALLVIQRPKLIRPVGNEETRSGIKHSQQFVTTPKVHEVEKSQRLRN